MNVNDLILEFTDKKSGNFELFSSDIFGHPCTKGVSGKTFDKICPNITCLVCGSLWGERNWIFWMRFPEFKTLLKRHN